MKGTHLSSGKGLKLAIIIAILLISFSIFYYLVIFLPQKNNQQLEQKFNSEVLKSAREASNRAGLESCLDKVNKGFIKLIEATKEDGTVISNDGAKIILDFVEQKKEECYKKYP